MGGGRKKELAEKERARERTNKGKRRGTNNCKESKEGGRK